MKPLCILLTTVLVLLLAPLPASAEGEWYILTYYGRATSNTFGEILWREWDMHEEYQATIGLGKELWRFKDWFGIDWEYNFSSHWGITPDYYEHASFFAVRWRKFPWNDYLRTTLGFGEGFSYTTGFPEHEERFHDKSHYFLNYLMWDFTVGLPQAPGLDIFFRVHHRSGIWRTINNALGAANYPTIGFKVTF
jgi:hypothetical protein